MVEFTQEEIASAERAARYDIVEDLLLELVAWASKRDPEFARKVANDLNGPLGDARLEVESSGLTRETRLMSLGVVKASKSIMGMLNIKEVPSNG